MRLKDKTRKERVRQLARSTVASSIFQWKLGLGPESVSTPPQTHCCVLHRSGIITPMCPLQTSANTRRETQRHPSSPGSVVWGSFCEVLLISQGHRTALELSPGHTRSAADRHHKYSPAMIHRHCLILSGTTWTQQ